MVLASRVLTWVLQLFDDEKAKGDVPSETRQTEQGAEDLVVLKAQDPQRLVDDVEQRPPSRYHTPSTGIEHMEPEAHE